MKMYYQLCIGLSMLAMLGACAEAKIGMGPFKAGSVEVGPGGVEATGPSAGPIQSGKDRGPDD
ncbi:MAG: hypothetical protein WEB02_10265 [Methylophaga sp.]